MPEIIGMQSLNALVERLQDVSNRLGRVDHEVTGPGPEIIGMQSLNALVERLQDVSNRLGRVDHEVTGPGPENDAEQRGKPVEGHLLARMADALVCVERNVSSLERATGLGAPAASQATAYRA